MKKLIILLSSIFEFIFYTFLMVLIGLLPINNNLIEFLIYFLGLFLVAILFYLIIRFLLQKLDMKAKKYIYYVGIMNLTLGIVAPIVLIFIIPNEVLTLFVFLVLISTVCYGIVINVFLFFFNYFLTNKKKNA